MGFVSGLQNQGIGAVSGIAGQQMGGAIGGVLDPVMAAIDGKGWQGMQTATPEQIQAAYDQSQGALKQQQDFVNALAAQHGIQNQSDVYNQYSKLAAGQGPNPAQAMLAQQTGQNVANQAALMAGQRGAAQNVGMIARQAGQQGGALQQQAVGQGATMQANQQLAAMNAQANIAGQQVGQQGNATMGYNQAAQGEQNQLLQAGTAANQQQAALAGQRLQGRYNMVGSMMGAAGAAAGAAHGGEVPQYAEGGDVAGAALSKAASSQKQSQGPAPIPMEVPSDKPSSFTGHYLTMGGPSANNFAQGGKVPAMVSPGEKYLSPQDVKKVEQGKASPLKAGEKIPGKAKVKGDDLKNDTVKKDLDAGGIVIPRSIVNSPDAEKKAAEFVSAILSRHGKSLKKPNKDK